MRRVRSDRPFCVNLCRLLCSRSIRLHSSSTKVSSNDRRHQHDPTSSRAGTVRAAFPRRRLVGSLNDAKAIPSSFACIHGSVTIATGEDQADNVSHVYVRREVDLVGATRRFVALRAGTYDVRQWRLGRMPQLIAVPQAPGDAMREFIGACLQIVVTQ